MVSKRWAPMRWDHGAFRRPEEMVGWEHFFSPKKWLDRSISSARRNGWMGAFLHPEEMVELEHFFKAKRSIIYSLSLGNVAFLQPEEMVG